MFTLPKAKKKKTTKKAIKKTLKKAPAIPINPIKRNICKSHTPYVNPLSIVLYLIGLIVIIYGAWFRELLWLMLGFVPIIVGVWWAYIIKK